MQRDALIVGVNTYQNLPGLKAPAQDAEAVAKMLQSYGEFRVHRLPEVIQSGQPQIGQKTQVTLQMLESALIQLFKPKGRSVAQTALFYFSGHGLQREAGIQEGFLAPSNADPDRGFYGLSLFWLRRLLQESPVRQRIIILDCCHSGELLNFLEADPGAAPGTDRLFMAASREYETAYESLDSPYSLFTQALLTGLDPHRSSTGIVNHHALTDWVNHQLKGEIQQPLFESSGSEIVLTRRSSDRSPTDFSWSQTELKPAQPSLVQATAKASPVCPYRGLAAFDESHAEFFFGRESLTAELVQKLKTDSFAAIVGASGIGKTSLMRAGLIPQLRRTHQRRTDIQWQIKLLTPAASPLKSLAAAFVDPAANGIERAEQLRRAEQLLQSGAAGFVQLVRGSLPQSFGTTELQAQRSRLLLIIDQFEEIFTQTKSDWERQQFALYLTTALQQMADCLRIVMVLRADFVQPCREFAAIAPLLAQHSIIVQPLSYEQLKAAIVRPAQQVGLRCEPNLVYTLLLDLMGAPGELALLQSVLLELWQRRQSSPEGVDCLTLDSYRELGGIRQLLPERATALFQRFDQAEQAIAQRIFLTLTQFGEGTEDMRRRVFKSQLTNAASAAEKGELVERILEKLVSAKLLVTDQPELKRTESGEPGDRISSGSASGDRQTGALPYRDAAEQPASDRSSYLTRGAKLLCRRNPSPDAPSSRPPDAVVDVAHETLIRHWTLLRQWCDRDRETLRQQRGLEEAAQAWYLAGQPASVEFLLTGQRLQEAEALIARQAQELSALTQEYVLASRQEAKRRRREARQIQIAVPTFLVAAIAVILGQTFTAIQSQTAKEHQLRLAIARERAAITQTILQDANRSEAGTVADSQDNAIVAALLIGRLAAQAEPLAVAQNSLRLALQSLRLQLKLPAAPAAIQQLEISPDRKQLAAASADGKIRLWSIQPYRLYSRTDTPQPGQILDMTIAVSPQPEAFRIASLRFSPDSQSIAAFAAGLPDILVWSTQYGALLLHLKGSAPVTQIHFSPTGEWLVSVHADRSLGIWRSDTGQLVTRLVQPQPIDSVQFSSDGQFLQIGFAHTTHRYRVTAAQDELSLQPAPLPIPASQVNHTAFSSQGSWTATLGLDGQISLWRSQTGQLVRRFPVSQAERIQFSPDEQTLAIETANALMLYDMAAGDLQRLDAGQISELTFSTDGRWLMTHSGQTNYSSPIVQLWDRKSGESLGTLPDTRLTAARFSPDSAYLITGDKNGQLNFWAVQQGGELPTLEQADASAAWIAFWQNDADQNDADQNDADQNSASQLLTIATSGHLQPWQLPAVPASPIVPLRPIPASAVHTAALKPQNLWKQLIQAAQRNIFTPANTALPAPASAKSQPQSSQPMPAKAEPAEAEPDSVPVSIAQSGWRQALAQIGGWNRMPASALGSALTPSTPLSSVAFSPDGERLATAELNGTIVLQQLDRTFQIKHQIQNSQIERASSLSQNSPASAAFRLLPAHSFNGENHGNNHEKTREKNQGKNQGKNAIDRQDSVTIHQLRFSPDGQLLLGVGDDFTVRLWQVESGELLQVWHEHQAIVHQARFSPDGKYIITASQDNTAQILSVPSAQAPIAAPGIPSGRAIRVLTLRTAVTSSSFSPDGQQIVTGDEDGKVRFYDQEGQLQMERAGHKGAILDLQYSPDGESIVTASADGTAIVWNARTQEQQAWLNPTRQEKPPLLQAAFSPDGQYVATLSQTGQVHLWAANWSHLLTLAQQRSPRQLTPEECSRYLNLTFDQCPRLALPNLSLAESLDK